MFEFFVRLTQLAAPPYSPASVSHLHQMSQVFFIDINNMIKNVVLNKMQHIFIHQMSLASGVYKTP